MLKVKRATENPIVSPTKNDWEKEGSFNGCASFAENKFHLVYRALSSSQSYRGSEMKVSSIGYAQSDNGIHFVNRRQLIKPEQEWEIFGCEDPRITYIDGKYFIFYTALSTYPFTPEGIHIGLAITKDFQEIEKHPVTFFNSKAMALFPQRIDGKLVGILTIDTDIPPAKIALAYFNKEEDIWSKDYWQRWVSSSNLHVIPLLRSIRDQLEIGAPPVKTKDGWLLIYSYIKNYFSPTRTFGIESVLLDLESPQKVIGQTNDPVLLPQENYELQGNVPNVVFPSGAVIKNEELFLYYGAADTTCCLATCELENLLKEILPKQKSFVFPAAEKKLQRFAGNPIISPRPEFAWESRATFNPAAIYEAGKVHILYRAMSQDNTSVLGYVQSEDGLHINERLTDPVYLPREDFEKKTKPYVNSGCEDPRLTKIEERIYMCYTAFDGTNPPRVALTSITVSYFLTKRWKWEKPQLISPPGVDDKDAFVFPKKIAGKYLIFHRIGISIWVDKVEGLNFTQGRWLGGQILASPRKGKWDNVKLGATGPAIETEKGWLLFYHGVSGEGMKYSLGAMLLDLEDPTKILARTENPLLEPEMPYEKEGNVPNVVFPCGNVVIGKNLFIYYGGADKVIGVAAAPLNLLLEELIR